MTLVPPGGGPRGACGDENEGVQDRFATNDADTLATAPYATAGDRQGVQLLIADPLE
jgi:hypothetical protein